MRSDSPFDESRTVPSSPRDARHPVSTPSPTIPGAWFGIALSLARRRFHRLWRVIFRHIAAPDAQFATIDQESQGTLGNPKERQVMSPTRVGISITYKTRVALENPCKERLGSIIGQLKDRRGF